MSSFAQPFSSSSDFPMISSVIIDADAWLIAQPRPSKAACTTTPSSIFSSSVISSPQNGLWSKWLMLGLSR